MGGWLGVFEMFEFPPRPENNWDLKTKLLHDFETIGGHLLSKTLPFYGFVKDDFFGLRVGQIIKIQIFGPVKTGSY